MAENRFYYLLLLLFSAASMADPFLPLLKGLKGRADNRATFLAHYVLVGVG
jgi:hypothetical protein